MSQITKFWLSEIDFYLKIPHKVFSGIQNFAHISLINVSLNANKNLNDSMVWNCWQPDPIKDSELNTIMVKKLKWPNIDLCFFSLGSTHVWDKYFYICRSNRTLGFHQPCVTWTNVTSLELIMLNFVTWQLVSWFLHFCSFLFYYISSGDIFVCKCSQ